MPALYSQMPHPFWRALEGLSSHRMCSFAVAIGIIAVTAHTTNGCAVPAFFKKGFSIGAKGISPSVFNQVITMDFALFL